MPIKDVISPVSRKGSSSLLKKVFEVSLWATLIQDPSARRTKDSQPSGFGFEYCASHVRFRVFQQTARVGSISGTPLSPGARSDPGRRDQTEPPTAEPQLQRRDRAAVHEEPPIPSSTPVTVGPKE
jgi:hypothetical protein